MDIGMIGLGRMGGNMARRLLRGGHRVVGWATDEAGIARLNADGGVGVRSLEELVAKLPAPRAVWVMVPAGAATEDTVRALAEQLAPGDTVVDGGNSYFKDDVRRAKLLGARGITFLDAGTSGGFSGAPAPEGRPAEMSHVAGETDGSGSLPALGCIGKVTRRRRSRVGNPLRTGSPLPSAFRFRPSAFLPFPFGPRPLRGPEKTPPKTAGLRT